MSSSQNSSPVSPLGHHAITVSNVRQRNNAQDEIQQNRSGRQFSEYIKTEVPFKDYLTIIAFAATITVSASISGSQGFATAGSFFGTSVEADAVGDPGNAFRQTRNIARWFSRAAMCSGCSLVVVLLLQILLTSPTILEPLMDDKGEPSWSWQFHLFMGGSFVGILLQGVALCMIGQALKAIDTASGWILQMLVPPLSAITLVIWLCSLSRKPESEKSTS